MGFDDDDFLEMTNELIQDSPEIQMCANIPNSSNKTREVNPGKYQSTQINEMKMRPNFT